MRTYFGKIVIFCDTKNNLEDYENKFKVDFVLIEDKEVVEEKTDIFDVDSLDIEFIDEPIEIALNKMDESDFDDLDTKTISNWSQDYLEQLDTSQHNFPNTLWHVKPPLEIALKLSAMLVISITGIFLNSIILTILLRNKWLWTASNYLVGNLAMTDLLTLLICPWFMLVRDFYQQYVLRNFGCRFEGFLQASFLLAGVCAVLLVSYDRLAAAALSAETRVTIKVAPYLIVASWLASMTVSLPWAVKREFVYGTIMWRLEWGVRELAARGG
ncbi:hypothetical protein HF086_010035, partial [Spodoptera exigua]